MEYTKEYYAQKQAEKRARDYEIYKYHAWERMPGESDKDFRRRFTKRIVIVINPETKIVLGPSGEILEPKEDKNSS